MARLIDADKIEYTSIAHLASYPVAPSPCDTVMRAEINAMPTIDAIPVEWIEETMQLAETVGAKEYAEHLEVLLADWAEREEDGKRT